MAEKRGRIEIIEGILDACAENDGLIKTHIVVITNLNSRMAYQYLQSMISQGLIQREDNLYIVTERGDNIRKGLDDLWKQLQLT